MSEEVLGFVPIFVLIGLQFSGHWSGQRGMGGAGGDGIHEGVGRRDPTAFGAVAMVELGVSSGGSIVL